MNWIMEIATAAGWSVVKPMGGEAYTYETADEASRMLRICYPDQVREDRLEGEKKRARVRNMVTDEVYAGWAV